MVERAKIKSNEMGHIKNSIRKGEGNLTGFLGELMVVEAFPGAQESNTHNYDVVRNGRKLEVKSKDRTIEPSLSYDVSVAAYNTRQAADYYLFCSLLRNKNEEIPHTGFILGFLAPEDFKSKARFIQKGRLDPTNNWKASCDCYNLSIGDLNRFNNLP
ncbi:hypothetical protein UFOVP28_36 [uncultured Caudovirales phage]|uniref:Uncharacterized protein n=1 Tax=uncultured Caudovirales phage TaxID=2100421 RepID=A0A6J5KLU3_9CAUD|nr:hypothetical protein UFOVP28_36 [uncultured Caudovirales phage]